MAPLLIVDFGRGLSPTLLLALTAAGIFGAFIYVAAFVLLQTKYLSIDGVIYSLLNVLGACLVLASLVAEWSTASCISNCIWLLIAIFGLRPRVRLRKRDAAIAPPTQFRPAVPRSRSHSRRRRYLHLKSVKSAQ